MTIRPIQHDDMAAITAIYNHYISNEIATFEESPLSVAEMTARIETIQQDFPVLVILDNENNVQGYAYGNHFKPRSAYRYTAEVSIYLSANAKGKGMGRQLYQQLMDELSGNGIREALAVLTSPNPSSEQFHQAMGFGCKGRLENVGLKFGEWLGISIWQKSLTTEPVSENGT